MNEGNKAEVFNRCPLCSNELEYLNLGQYSEAYRILKNGKISSVRKYKRDEGSMECGFIVCTKCNFHTNTDYETDTTGDYERIKIFQNNNNQFMAEMYK